MKKKYKNSLIGVIIVAFLTLFLSFNTIAAEKVKKECSPQEAENIQERYNLEVNKKSNGEYEIAMKGYPEDLDDAKFKVIGTGTDYEGIDGNAGTIKDIDKIAEITKDNPATFSATPTMSVDGEQVLAVVVELVPKSTDTDCKYTETIVYKEIGDSQYTNIFYDGVDNTNSKYVNGTACYYFYNGTWNSIFSKDESIKKSDFEKYNYKAVAGKNVDGESLQGIYDSVLDYCNQTKVTPGAGYTEEDIIKIIADSIAYVKARTTTVGGGTQTFKQAFNEIKNNVPDSKKQKISQGSKPTDSSVKCPATDPAKAVNSLTDDYYQNKAYYYAEQSLDDITVTYKYNYAPGNVETEAKTVCTRKCAEAVKLEYGPPVASKAGLCFEYKVKATSYVECTADIKAAQPKLEKTYCTPVAYCHEKNYRWEGHQAGPTEDFDECIQSCDGGRYTSSCSKKCYKEVYSNTKLSRSLTAFNTLTAQPMAFDKDLEQLYKDLDTCIEDSSDGGCYYWNGNAIRWKSKYHSGSGYSNDPKALGRWYRIVGWGISDVGANKSFDVSSNGIKTKKYVAYYGGGHCQDRCSWRTNVCRKGMYLNPNSALEDYKDNVAAYKSAVAECKTTATCSTNTAEFTISTNYSKKTKDGEEKVTVKLPTSGTDKLTSGSNSNSLGADRTVIAYDGCYKGKDAKNRYMTEWGFPGTYINNKTGEVSYLKPAGVAEGADGVEGWHFEEGKYCTPLDSLSVNSKYWEKYKLGKSYTDTEINSSLDYNISATASNFGYLGWNFTVSCFYSMAPETIKTGVMDYTFRPVDTQNIFPNVPVAGETEDGYKRYPGFNWTSQAAIPTAKNGEYTVDPEKLIQEIKEKADNNTEYSEENLDYQFYLTPKVLNRIRAYNDNNPYGDWTRGSEELINGISAYKSNLWRGSGSLLTAAEAKKVGQLGVNNQ